MKTVLTFILFFLPAAPFLEASEMKLLAFAGSTREDSLNKKLLNVAVKDARLAGAKVTVIDLRDYPIPFYDGDLEAKSGLPENARKIKKLMIENDGFLIASPEYNGSYSAVLKNLIDWMSRPVEGEQALIALKGKKAALLAASPGGGGGAGSLKHLRQLLTRLKVDVFVEQITIPHATEAFNSQGELTDVKKRLEVKQFIQKILNE